MHPRGDRNLRTSRALLRRPSPPASAWLGGAAAIAAGGASAGVKSPQPTRTPIDKYAWSDETKKVKVYLDLQGVGALDDAAVVLTHTQDSVAVHVNELAGKNYSFMENLRIQCCGYHRPQY